MKDTDTEIPKEVAVFNSDIGSSSPAFEEKHQNGVVLIPQPSDDPRDPLNWPFRKKLTIVAVLSWALFTGYAAPFCGQLNLIQQSKLYHKTVVQITYFNSAASAGLATGGFFYSPLSHKFGRCSVVFWAVICCLASQIWAAEMTGEHQYWAYFMSRFFAGFFGMVVSVVGPRFLVDMFFLHQRGRAFTVLHLALNFGASASPTISGYIAAKHYWTVEYWWSVAVLSLAAILVFCFLEETEFDRANPEANVELPQGFISNRVRTFLPGNKIVKSMTLSEVAKIGILPFKIACSPVVLLVAGFDMISFGFYVALNALTPVWLQKPAIAGGYGFTVTENATFSLVHWIGVVVGLLYGQCFSDRIPLWLVSRNGGVWQPEFRLHALWLTNFILMPVGLGLVGAALQYKLHWAVLAFAQVLVTIGSLVSIPVTVNYICECFRSHTIEATIPVNSMRLFLGLSINFYINYWIAAVTIGWVYGMMAFFTIFSFFFLIILMWKGHIIRQWTPFGLESSEEGEHLLEGKHAHGV